MLTKVLLMNITIYFPFLNDKTVYMNIESIEKYEDLAGTKCRSAARAIQFMNTFDNFKIRWWSYF